MRKVIKISLCFIVLIMIFFNISDISLDKTIEHISTLQLNFDNTYECWQRTKLEYIPNIREAFSNDTESIPKYYEYQKRIPQYVNDLYAGGLFDEPQAGVFEIVYSDGLYHADVFQEAGERLNIFDKVLQFLQNAFRMIVNFVTAIIDDLYTNVTQFITWLFGFARIGTHL